MPGRTEGQRSPLEEFTREGTQQKVLLKRPVFLPANWGNGHKTWNCAFSPELFLACFLLVWSGRTRDPHIDFDPCFRLELCMVIHALEWHIIKTMTLCVTSWLYSLTASCVLLVGFYFSICFNLRNFLLAFCLFVFVAIIHRYFCRLLQRPGSFWQLDFVFEWACLLQ